MPTHSVQGLTQGEHEAAIVSKYPDAHLAGKEFTRGPEDVA